MLGHEETEVYDMWLLLVDCLPVGQNELQRHRATEWWHGEIAELVPDVLHPDLGAIQRPAGVPGSDIISCTECINLSP